MEKFRRIVLIVILTFIGNIGLGQVSQDYLKSTDQQQLRALSTKFEREYLNEKADAVEVANVLGLPVSYETEGSHNIELQGFDDSGMLLYYSTENLTAAQTVSTDQVWSGGNLGLNLSGNNYTIGQWDGGAIYKSHQDLTGRVTQQDGAAITSGHGTHVAGTMIGAGNNSQAKGMANQGSLDAYDFSNDESEMANAASAGLLISNHSYGAISGWRYNGSKSRWEWWGNIYIDSEEDWRFGYYSSDSKNWDQIAANAPHYLIVKAAGNDRNDNHTGSHYVRDSTNTWVQSSASRDKDGDYDCITPRGVAKNILTVGAVSDISGGYSSPSDVQMTPFSGWGPTDDGRIKPDIVANGTALTSCGTGSTSDYTPMTGTSMSSPNATGSLTLLQEHYYNLNSRHMESATLKGLVIHTADEAGNKPGPDYKHGWGLLNTSNAADHISNGSGDRFILERSLANKDTFTFNVYSDGNQPLTATTSWTDVPGTPPSPALDPSNLMLENDLDLRIINDSTGNVNQPYVLNPSKPASAASKGDNFRDNVEKVNLANPDEGWYTIRVTHKNNLYNQNDQDFALILSGGASPCPQPSNLTVSNINTNSANISWSSGDSADVGYQVIYGESGFDLASEGNSMKVSEQEDTTLYNLTQGMNYEAYIAEICSNGDTSASAGPITFTTQCGVNNPPSLMIFDRTYPNCWSKSSSNAVTTSNTCGNNNTYTLQLNGQTGAKAISNIFDLSNTYSIEVSYDYRAGSDNNCGDTPESNDSIGVTYWNGNQWIKLAKYSGGQAPKNFTSDQFIITNGLTDTFKLKFEIINGSGVGYDNWNFDSLKIQEGTCPKVSDMAANPDTNTAEITWTSNANTNQWELEYGPSGFNLGNGNFVTNIKDTFKMLNGLNAGTHYDVYVRETCNAGNKSTFEGPLSFTTDCPSKKAPIQTNFDGVTAPEIPACWTPYANIADQILTVTSTDHNKTIPSVPHAIEIKSGNINNNDTAIIVSPSFKDLPSGNNQISFKATGETIGSNESLIIGIMGDPTDLSTFTSYDTLTNNQLDTTFKQYNIVLNNTNLIGNKKHVAFMHGPGNSEIYLDDFKYETRNLSDTITTWSGSQNTDWSDSSNWMNGYPSPDAYVKIPSGKTRYPKISSNKTIGTVVIDTNASLNILAGDVLTLRGNLVNKGSNVLGAGTVKFDGNKTQEIRGSSEFNNAVIKNDVVILPSAGMQLLNGVLTLNSGTMTTNSKLKLNADSNGYAQIAGTGNGSISGDVIYEQRITTDQAWHYLATPVSGINFTNLHDDFHISEGQSTNVYYYDEPSSQSSFLDGWSPLTDRSNAFQPMKGYNVYFWKNDKGGANYPLNMEVEGKPNEGAYSTTLTSSASQWNLVGNPYPSGLDWDKVSSGMTSNIYDGVYIWDPKAGQFATYVNGISTNGGSSVIAPMQSFFVWAKSGTPSLQFGDADRTTQNGPYFKKSNKPDSSIKLAINNEQQKRDEVVVYFTQAATKNFDGGYDAFDIPSKKADIPSLSTLINGKKASINALPQVEEEMTVPLAFSSNKAGKYTFDAKLNSFGSNTNVYLHDRQNGKRYNFSNHSKVKFKHDPSSADEGRFVLKFGQVTSGIRNRASQDLNFNARYQNGGFKLDIRSDFDQKAIVNVVDLTGEAIGVQKELNNKGQHHIKASNLPEGYYLVKLRTNQHWKVKKVLVR